jgi:diguanylate cyclase (GGDEF)-like protein
MNQARAAKINFVYVTALAVLIVLVILLADSFWIAAVFGLALASIMCAVILGHLKLLRVNSLINNLYENEKNHNFSLASKLLGDILKDASGTRSFRKKAAELISGRFRAEKLAVFFKYKSGYEVKMFYNIHPRAINRPGVDKIRKLVKEIPAKGKMLTDEKIGRQFINEKTLEEFKSFIMFAYNWGKSRSVIVICDDPEGHFSEAFGDNEFNRILWPSLDDILKHNEKAKQKEMELKNIKGDFSRLKRDLADAGRMINRRTSELNAFVDISADLYSILDEGQLFSALKDIITNQIGAEKVEILYPTGEGKYIVDESSEELIKGDRALVLDTDSEFFELLMKKPKPLLLPLAASVLKAGNGFLKSAISSGFQIISPLGSGDEIGCLLLIGEKKEGGQYDDTDINSVSVITNIASLSLANIRQFATIEKLSYTDSMTGIFNYRYFYKRLGEEILRAKRYDRELSLVILDIDNFKIFNDNYGHQTGDTVLKSIADLITKAIRSIDIVSRYGGEEFCIIMPDTGEKSGRIFIDRLRKEIAEFSFRSGSVPEGISITVSVGCSVFPHHATTPDRLIYCADMALLKAKALGRNRAIMYQSNLAESEFQLREGEL